jgi:protein-S-isoprenylcysteine O-methyltransferase Ste14
LLIYECLMDDGIAIDSIYMTILLVHRVIRDDSRLSAKYGEDWKKYCAIVRWRTLPLHH